LQEKLIDISYQRHFEHNTRTTPMLVGL